MIYNDRPTVYETLLKENTERLLEGFLSETDSVFDSSKSSIKRILEECIYYSYGQGVKDGYVQGVAAESKNNVHDCENDERSN